MKRLILGLMLLAMAMTPITAVSTARAQAATDNESITLSPVSRKYALDAGSLSKDTMTVINDGKTAYDFIVYSRPYSVTDEAYKPDFTKTPTNADAYTWVQFEKTQYHLEPGASTKVEFSIRVPTKAAPGGHYGVIFAETQPIKGQESANSVVRKKRVGMLLYATVNGKLVNEGEVTSTTIPFWQPQPPLTATATVKNRGNTDFANKTTYTVKDLFGNTKYQASKEYTILPDTTRKLSFEWPGASWFGLYKVEIAQTVLGKQTSNSGYVLMLPRYIPFLLLVLLGIGGVYVWVRRKKE